MTKKRYSMTEQEAKTEPDKRKHCPDCGIYRDGHRMANDNGGPLFCPTPGMRFVFWSTGNIYQRAGTMIPCTCASGNLVAAGYERDSVNVHRAKYPIAEYRNGVIVQVVDKVADKFDMNKALKISAA